MLYLTHTFDKIYQTAFYKFNVFRLFCTMMIMRWRNVQIAEYDIKAETYPTVCIRHKLHNNNMSTKHLRYTSTEIYDNYGKGGYFRFDDDYNNIS